MTPERIFQLAGLVLLGALVALAVATLLGVSGAGVAAITLVMLGAAVLGVQRLVNEPSTIELAASVLLVASGIAGAAVTVSGGNPFDRWEVIGPMAIGLAITFLVGNG